MKSSRKTKNIRQTSSLTPIPGGVESDKISTILPNDPIESGRVTRSRRNTFTYGQAGEGSSSQLSTAHELVPYSKEWTVILLASFKTYLLLFLVNFVKCV